MGSAFGNKEFTFSLITKSIVILFIFLSVASRMKGLNCNYCSFATVTASVMKRHVDAIHLRLKPHKCEHCTYASPHRVTLKRHTRVKHASKPYPCRNCASAFEDKSDLIKHNIEFHPHNIFRCEKCEFTASYKSQLSMHINAVHLGLRQFKCDLCSFAAGFLAGVRYHKKANHSVEMIADSKAHMGKESSISEDTETDSVCQTPETTRVKCNNVIRKSSNVQKQRINKLSEKARPKENLQQNCESETSIGIMNETTEVNIAKCQICGFEAANEDNLTGHILDQHVTC